MSISNPAITSRSSSAARRIWKPAVAAGRARASVIGRLAGRGPALLSAIGRSTVPPQSGQPSAFSRATVLQRAPGPT